MVGEPAIRVQELAACAARLDAGTARREFHGQIRVFYVGLGTKLAVGVRELAAYTALLVAGMARPGLPSSRRILARLQTAGRAGGPAWWPLNASCSHAHMLIPILTSFPELMTSARIPTHSLLQKLVMCWHDVTL